MSNPFVQPPICAAAYKIASNSRIRYLCQKLEMELPNSPVLQHPLLQIQHFHAVLPLQPQTAANHASSTSYLLNSN